MFDLSFLSQSMWDIYSLCSSAGKPGFNRSAELDSLAGLNFMDLMRNVDGSTKYAVSDPKKQLMDDCTCLTARAIPKKTGLSCAAISPASFRLWNGFTPWTP